MEVLARVCGDYFEWLSINGISSFKLKKQTKQHVILVIQELESAVKQPNKTHILSFIKNLDKRFRGVSMTASSSIHFQAFMGMYVKMLPPSKHLNYIIDRNKY